MKNGQRISGASQDDFTEFFLGDEPPKPNLSEGLGFQETVDVTSTGFIPIDKRLTRTQARSLVEQHGQQKVIDSISARIEIMRSNLPVTNPQRSNKLEFIANLQAVRAFISG